VRELSGGVGVAVGPPAPVVGVVPSSPPVVVVEAVTEALGVLVDEALEAPHAVATRRTSASNVSER
jgi:hypothetical protein